MGARAFVLLLAGLLVAVTSEAAVLCAHPRRDGTLNTSVRVREACKPTEVQLGIVTLAPLVVLDQAQITTTTTSTTSSTLQSGCFQDWGDGTIRDTCTGLQWEKKTTAVGSGVNATDLHDVDNRYNWAGCCNGDCTALANYCQPNAAAAATCAAHSDGGTLGCSECGSGTCNVDPFTVGAITTVWDWLNGVNAANFAGHSDWRLPSENGCNSCYTGRVCPCSSSELETIYLAPPPPCGPDACIASIFGPTPGAGIYWSASTSRYRADLAWTVDFGGDGVIDLYKDTEIHVRAVR